MEDDCDFRDKETKYQRAGDEKSAFPKRRYLGSFVCGLIAGAGLDALISGHDSLVLVDMIKDTALESVGWSLAGFVNGYSREFVARDTVTFAAGSMVGQLIYGLVKYHYN